MQHALELLISYPGLAVLALLAVASGLWQVWDFRIRPLFVSPAEIGRLADELSERHGARAREIARIEEHRAWCYADAYAQGVWRRVRKELRRR